MGARKRTVELRRSWLFLPGAEREVLLNAATSGGDVLIQEFEDFTPPARRPEAREISVDILAAWKRAGAIAAVRVNPLDEDGLLDLEAAMRGAPDIVFLPKVERPDHVTELDRQVGRLERELGLEPGATELVPNVETAAGFLRLGEILGASPRIRAAIAGGEDMGADLGVERSRDSAEMAHLRAQFHLIARGHGKIAVDQPYTWTDLAGCEADTLAVRRLGYVAKTAVHPPHCAVINRVLTPSVEAAASARRIVAAFEAARARGEARVEVDGSLVEVPIYLNAKRLAVRADAFGMGRGEGGA